MQVSEIDVAGVPCHVTEPAEPTGTLLYFFGGGYVSGAPEYDLPIIAALASLASLRVVAPRYALAPEHPFPAGLDQCFAVYRALAGTPRLALGGESAGGGMAMAVMRRAMAEGGVLPGRLALFSPWSDLTDAGLARSVGIDDPTLTVDDLELCKRAYLGAVADAYTLVSPGIGAIPQGWPATFLTTGSRDLLGPTVRSLAALLVADGAECHLIDRQDMWHVFEVYDELSEADNTLRAAAAFLSG